MRTSYLIAGPALALALGLATTGAQAAPASPGVALKSESTSAVEKARCWWHRGHRHCSGVSFYFGPRWHNRWHHRRHWRRW